MHLYLLRHAAAVPLGVNGIATDAERPLTENGRQQCRAVALALRRLGVRLDRLVASPLVRAQQRTAQYQSDGRLSCSSMEIAVLPSGTTRIVASRCAITTQKHPTNGRNGPAASWNRISARWTRVPMGSAAVIAPT